MPVASRFIGALVLLLIGTGALAADVVGRVTRNGKAQSGIELTIVSTTPGSKPQRTLTDKGGNYEFTGLSTGEYVLTCSDRKQPQSVLVTAGSKRVDWKD
jgi:Carboxypeptidase regulatory-like domain